MRVIATIEHESIVERDDGSIEYTSKAAVDNDGPNGNPEHDRCHQESTSLKVGGRSLDAETVRYIVVPPAVVAGVKGVVLGCMAWVDYGDVITTAVVADVGPTAHLGEISVACAKALGLNPSPISGGVDAHVVRYKLWPGVPAVVDGVVFPLQAS